MCKFFSCILTRKGKILFTEKDSHEEAIMRSGLKDDGESFIRIECEPPFEDIRIDEQTLPEWAEKLNFKDDVRKLAKKVATAREAYEKATATAWEAYIRKLKKMEGYLEAK